MSIYTRFQAILRKLSLTQIQNSFRYSFVFKQIFFPTNYEIWGIVPDFPYEFLSQSDLDDIPFTNFQAQFQKYIL